MTNSPALKNNLVIAFDFLFFNFVSHCQAWQVHFPASVNVHPRSAKAVVPSA